VAQLPNTDFLTFCPLGQLPKPEYSLVRGAGQLPKQILVVLPSFYLEIMFILENKNQKQMNGLPQIHTINLKQISATSNSKSMETTHFVTHIEKIMWLNVLLHIH